MASSPSAAAAATGVSVPPRYKYRLRFRKSGDLRFISHIDLLHAFERLLRRAALPLASTQGFHPKPRLTFAHALALGVEGQNEVVEIECSESFADAEVLDRLRRQAPPGIEFHSCRSVATKMSAQVRRAWYLLTLPEPVPALPDRCASLLAQPACWIERTRPQRRRLNLRPFISELHAAPHELTMALWITPNGAARPDEIALALGLGESLTQGAALCRTNLEIMDEQPESERWLPEIPRLTEMAAEHASTVAAKDESRTASLPTPLLANPLSFDS